jgi:hypothetical protein
LQSARERLIIAAYPTTLLRLQPARERLVVDARTLCRRLPRWLSSTGVAGGSKLGEERAGHHTRGFAKFLFAKYGNVKLGDYILKVLSRGGFEPALYCCGFSA